MLFPPTARTTSDHSDDRDEEVWLQAGVSVSCPMLGAVLKSREKAGSAKFGQQTVISKFEWRCPLGILNCNVPGGTNEAGGLDARSGVTNERLAGFRRGFEKLRWSEGSNERIDYRFAPAGTQAHLLARELVALQPYVILAQSTPRDGCLETRDQYDPYRVRWRHLKQAVRAYIDAYRRRFGDGGSGS